MPIHTLTATVVIPPRAMARFKKKAEKAIKALEDMRESYEALLNSITVDA